MKSLSRVRLFVTLWTVAYQAPLSMGFSRQERWSGLPFPSPGELPDPRIKPGSPALQADALLSEPPGKLTRIWEMWSKPQNNKDIIIYVKLVQHHKSTVKVKVKSLSRVRLFVTLWTVAYQAPLSMGFSRQEYWNGLPFPSPEDLPDPSIEPRSPALQPDTLPSEPPGKSI